jgi:hypothetical protein
VCGVVTDADADLPVQVGGEPGPLGAGGGVCHALEVNALGLACGLVKVTMDKNTSVQAPGCHKVRHCSPQTCVSAIAARETPLTNSSTSCKLFQNLGPHGRDSGSCHQLSLRTTVLLRVPTHLACGAPVLPAHPTSCTWSVLALQGLCGSASLPDQPAARLPWQHHCGQVVLQLLLL